MGGVTFNQAIKELKDNFKMIDNYITEENIKPLFEYIYKPKELASHLTNFIVYDLETHKTDRTRPYCISFYQLGKFAGRYNRDLTPYEKHKCKKGTLVFDGDNCVSNALDILLKLKGEERNVRNKVFEYNLQLHAHNGSGFDTWIILNNLPCDKHFVDFNKIGKDIISLRVFNGYIYKGENKFLNI